MNLALFYSRTRIGLAVCFLVANVACGSQSQERTDWSELARTDIEAAHKLVLENHPGPVDSENPGFRATEKKAFEEALSLAGKIHTQAGFKAALRAYIAPFRDGHFTVSVPLPGEAAGYWPGFVVGWRAGQFTVTGAESDQESLVGAQLVSCDGKSADEMMRQNVFRFGSGKPDQPAYWARLAPRLLLDDGNPFIKRANRCLFQEPDGREIRSDLKWRQVGDEYWSLSDAARFGGRPAPGLHEFGPGRYWINLSNFSPRGKSELRAVKDSIADVRAHRDQLRRAQAIVIDMRGNRGGSSSWAQDYADALWGRNYRRWREPDDPTGVDWRVSKSNLEHVESFKQMLARAGHLAVYQHEIAPVVKGMQKALTEERPFYREEGGPDANRPSRPVADPVRGKVYLLTHGECASACLDGADLFLAMQGVIQVGYPTSSDTNYLEVRQTRLPSGKARLIFPIKVYRGRKRASGAYYDPAIRYDGFDWSNKAMEAWMMKVIDGKIK